MSSPPEFIGARPKSFERLADSNDVLVSFEPEPTAGKGEPFTVRLSPQAQTFLLTALLATPKAQVAAGAFQTSRAPIRVREFALYHAPNNTVGMEASIDQLAAVLLACDRSVLAKLRAAIDAFDKTPPAAARH